MEIEALEKMLLDHMRDEIPGDLDQLSTHTQVLNVSDVDIDSFDLTCSGLRLDGKGTVDVELAYGSERDRERDDDGVDTNEDSFDFSYDVIVEDGSIKSAKITVDTEKFTAEK